MKNIYLIFAFFFLFCRADAPQIPIWKMSDTETRLHIQEENEERRFLQEKTMSTFRSSELAATDSQQPQPKTRLSNNQ
jgi:hypothetical protein